MFYSCIRGSRCRTFPLLVYDLFIVVVDSVRVQLPRNLSTESEDWPVHILETTMYQSLWIWLLNFYE
jgi:hypothetical protein